MSCYDFFNFEKDFKFQNHKGDIVIIPKGEYQTKSLDNMLNGLIINCNNEIEKPIYKTEVFVEYPKNDPRRWKTEKIGYEKIDFFGTAFNPTPDDPEYGIFLFKSRLGGEYTEFIGEFDYILIDLEFLLGLPKNLLYYNGRTLDQYIVYN